MLDFVQTPLTHVMDVGCATGDFTDLLSKHGPDIQTVLGVDCVEAAVERARRRYPHLTFGTEHILTLGDKYPGCFDLITCLEVIYYLAKPQQINAVRSLQRALRPGGYVVFSSMISPPPYFFPNELRDLVGSQFEIVRSEILHLRMISLVEKCAGKLARLIPTPIAAHRLGKLPLSSVIGIEKWSRKFNSLTASHAILLARVPTSNQSG
jgi:2-polyprenyl-3-methyl-5-hydroxy-6-metoxy-1,4-benzoquinol methylase